MIRGRHLAYRFYFQLRRLNSGRRLLPSFIIIGTQKGGTSSLYQYLVNHPDVGAACRKEVHYFDLNFSRGLGWYQAHFPLIKTNNKNFITGEASPYYVDHPHVAKRISDGLPAAKLILLLRDPVDRAFSHYKHNLTMQREKLGFQEALKHELEVYPSERRKLEQDEALYSKMDHAFCYLHRGIYADHISRWFKYFQRDQLLILKSEDLFFQPSETFAQVLKFLNLRAWAPAQYENFYKGAGGASDSETRTYLKEFYVPHNQRLYQMLGRDFGWET